MKNGNGKTKVTRTEYERSRKILERWEKKVVEARTIVKYWETVEARNKERIGKNVLMAIVEDSDGRATIHFESLAQVAPREDVAATLEPAGK